MTVSTFLLLILLAFLLGVVLVILILIRIASNNPERTRLMLGGQSVLDAEYYRAKSEAATDTVNFFGRLIATNFQYIRGQEIAPTTPPLALYDAKRHDTPFETPLITDNPPALQIGEIKQDKKDVEYPKVTLGKGISESYKIGVTPQGGCTVRDKDSNEVFDTFDLHDVYIGTPYEIENTNLYCIRCQNCRGWKITKEKGSANCTDKCKLEFHRKTKSK